MPDEIGYLAVIQISGLVEEGSVLSRGFASHLDAVRWVRDQAEEAHGEAATVIPSFTKLSYDLGGEPTRVERWLWTIITPGGPTWGMVVDVTEAFPQQEASDVKAE